MPGRIQELLDLVDQIATLERKLHESKKQQDKINDQLRTVRAQIELDIAAATDEQGKRLYSNEDMRKSARIIWFEKDEEYQRLRRAGAAHIDEQNELSIERKRLSDRKEILKMVLGLVLLREWDYDEFEEEFDKLLEELTRQA